MTTMYRKKFLTFFLVYYYFLWISIAVFLVNASDVSCGLFHDQLKIERI